MKQQVIKELSKIAEENRSNHRFVAYNRAISSLHSLSDSEFITRDDYDDLKYVGSKINQQIKDFKLQNKVPDEEKVKVRKGFTTIRVEKSVIDKIIYSNLLELLPYSIFVGSYRRGSNSIADIDIIVFDENYVKVVELLSSKFQVLVSGDTKSSFLVDTDYNIQLDVNRVNQDDLAFALLHHTGSVRHNVMMRGIAKGKGYILNQYGLFKGEERIHLDTEEEVFEYLGMEYVKPEDR